MLAFSPGEYLGSEDTAVRTAAAKLTMPVYITSALNSDELGMGKEILDTVSSSDKTQFIPQKNGVHGSSTLLDKANPDGAEENWDAVLAFLKKHS